MFKLLEDIEGRAPLCQFRLTPPPRNFMQSGAAFKLTPEEKGAPSPADVSVSPAEDVS